MIQKKKQNKKKNKNKKKRRKRKNLHTERSSFVSYIFFMVSFVLDLCHSMVTYSVGGIRR